MFIESHDKVLNLSKFYGWGWNVECVGQTYSAMATLYLLDERLEKITLELSAFVIDSCQIEAINQMLRQGSSVKCEDYINYK
jgi:hypothetical protein